jgi:hypothetical protein
LRNFCNFLLKKPGSEICFPFRIWVVGNFDVLHKFAIKSQKKKESGKKAYFKLVVANEVMLQQFSRKFKQLFMKSK